MSGRPRVEIIEEGMREGMQIESAAIPAADKIRLLDALSATGLRHIVVGSFVSPRWVPQMAEIEKVIAGFTPREGVVYSALALNQRGAERREELTPPLTPRPAMARSTVHLCDVFVQRNTGRNQADEWAALPRIVDAAKARGVTEATVAVNAAWGSNWLGLFSLEQRVETAARQVEAWTEAGIPVTTFWIGDPMSWNTPRAVEETLGAFLERWPAVTRYHLHLHDGRGSALVSAYQALRTLSAGHTLVLDTSIGGMGGCPYCGNGRATKMIPTEDLVDLLHEEGIDTGIDLAPLIEAAHLAEEVVGHELYGKVSKTGPRPRGADLYAMDMPLVETIDEAQHFRLGPSVYADCPRPWKAPITSTARDVVEDTLDGALGSAPDGTGGASDDPLGSESDGTVGSTSGDAVGGTPDDAAGTASGGPLGGAPGGAVGSVPDDALGSAPDGTVGSASGGPLGGARGGAVGSVPDDALGSAPDGTVGGASDGAVGGAPGGAVGSVPDDALGSAPDGTVGSAPGGPLGGAPGGAVGSVPDDAPGNALDEALGNAPSEAPARTRSGAGEA